MTVDIIRDDTSSFSASRLNRSRFLGFLTMLERTLIVRWRIGKSGLEGWRGRKSAISLQLRTYNLSNESCICIVSYVALLKSVRF